jgi:streptogramin lyase
MVIPRWAAACALVLLAGCSSADPAEPSPGRSTTTSAAPSGQSARVQKVIDLGGGEAYGLAVDKEAVWAISYDAGSVSRIDPASGTIAFTTRLGPGTASVFAGDEGVWVAGLGDSASIYRLDPATGRVLATVPGGDLCCDLSVGGGALWTVDARGSLLRVDLASAQVTKRIPVTIDRNAHTNAVYAGGALWVSSDPTKLFRVDPVSGASTAFDVGGGVPFLARDGLVWGAAPTSLWAVDEKTGAVVRRVPLADSMEVLSLELGYGAIWVGIRHPGRVGAVLRLDAATGAVVDEVRDIEIPARIAAGFGSIWVTDSGSSKLYRLASST